MRLEFDMSEWEWAAFILTVVVVMSLSGLFMAG